MNGSIRLFRAVSPQELADLLASGFFRPVPASMQGKWFAETQVNAMEWGRRFYQVQGSTFHIVQIDLPQNVADQMFCLANLDQIGPARYAEGDVLDLLNKTFWGMVEIQGGP